MDVARLSNAVSIGKPEVLQDRSGHTRKGLKARKPQSPPPPPDKTQLRMALDRAIRNTRFQYDIKDKIGYFVVRIIDKDTDKVIREIPSKEIQTVREHIEQVLGILFDEEI